MTVLLSRISYTSSIHNALEVCTLGERVVRTVSCVCWRGNSERANLLLGMHILCMVVRSGCTHRRHYMDLHVQRIFILYSSWQIINTFLDLQHRQKAALSPRSSISKQSTTLSQSFLTDWFTLGGASDPWSPDPLSPVICLYTRYVIAARPPTTGMMRRQSLPDE